MGEGRIKEKMRYSAKQKTQIKWRQRIYDICFTHNFSKQHFLLFVNGFARRQLAQNYVVAPGWQPPPGALPAPSTAAFLQPFSHYCSCSFLLKHQAPPPLLLGGLGRSRRPWPCKSVGGQRVRGVYFDFRQVIAFKLATLCTLQLQRQMWQKQRNSGEGAGYRHAPSVEFPLVLYTSRRRYP
jgi:hypothetical protein